MSSNIQNINELSIEDINRKFLEDVSGALVIYSVFVLPLSIYRTWDGGWLPIHFIQISLSLFIVGIFLIRKNLSRALLAVHAVGIILLASVTGLYQYGILAAGFQVGLVGIFVLIMIGNKRVIILTSLTYAVLILSISYMWVTGSITASVSADKYIILPSTWAFQIANVLFIIIILYLSAHNYLLTLRHVITHARKQALELKKQKEHIEHLANHDYLTGLPTMRLGKDRLEMAINLAHRSKSKSALLYLDLDGFKAVNDSAGHDAGDAILKAVANRMLLETRETDSCCRVGGDEFLIIVPDITEISLVKDICSRLIDVINQPVEFNGLNLSVGVSIGAAFYPDNAKDAFSLRNAADEAMYEVKNMGKNNFKLLLPLGV